MSKNIELLRIKLLIFRKKIKTIDRSITSYKRTVNKIFESELKKLFKKEICQAIWQRENQKIIQSLNLF